MCYTCHAAKVKHTIRATENIFGNLEEKCFIVRRDKFQQWGDPSGYTMSYYRTFLTHFQLLWSRKWFAAVLQLTVTVSEKINYIHTNKSPCSRHWRWCHEWGVPCIWPDVYSLDSPTEETWHRGRNSMNVIQNEHWKNKRPLFIVSSVAI